MARSQGRKAPIQSQKEKWQEFYADDDKVFCKPQRTKHGTMPGFLVCLADPFNAKQIAKALNAKKARRIIKKLLTAFEGGSALEEKFLTDILEAECYLQKGEW